MTLDEANITVEYLKEMQEGYIEGEGYERHPLPEWYALDKALEVIEQTSWIPVSERLPEKNMACLVAIGKFNLTQMAMYSDLMGTINHRIFYQGDVGYGSFEDITEYVKAWMPLPTPYEPQERSDKE